MSITEKYLIKLDTSVEREELSKGCWLIIINAMRVPPHIGFIFNGYYSSLNIKGKEQDIELATLLRSIDIQKKKCVLVKLRRHPVFSVDFLHDHFLHELQSYDRVTEKVTCFTPVRSFMNENYLLKQENMAYLYEMFPVLYREDMIELAFGINLGNAVQFEFSPYNMEDYIKELSSARNLNPVND